MKATRRKGFRRSCRYYDWGKTAPSAYGAFCALHEKPLMGQCLNCKKYIRGVFK